MKPIIIALIALLISPLALAQRSAPADEKYEGMDTVELPPVHVLGEKQEMAMRLIRSALDRGRVYGWEAREQLYCWYHHPTGSHLLYMYCTQNKWLNKMQNLKYFSRPTFKSHIYRSPLPINPLQMERRLARLGPTAVNDEIVARTKQGEPLPDNVPSRAEVERFAAALGEIKAIRTSNEGDKVAETRMVAAIEAQGLTVDRYNHISKLVERYASLQKMVRDRP